MQIIMPAEPTVSEIRATPLRELKRLQCSWELEPTRRFQIGLLEMWTKRAPLCSRVRPSEIPVGFVHQTEL